jgi:hypothetical protein
LTLSPEWRSRAFLEDHFRRHGADVGARTLERYVQLARETVRAGVRFTFRQTSRHRVGYYHLRRRRLVILTDDEETILSLSRQSTNYVLTLPDSTYGR